MPARSASPLLTLTIAFIGMLAFMQVYCIQAILPILQTAYGAGPVKLGLAVGATVLGMGAISPFIGMISDAYGRRRMIQASIFLLTLPIALIGFAPSIDVLIAERLVLGLLVPGMTVTLMAYIGEEFRGAEIGKLTSCYVAGTVFGGFSGRFLLGHLSEHMPWSWAMMILAGLNFLGFVLVLWQLPASRNFIPKPHLSDSFADLKAHLHNRAVMGSCILGFFVLFSLVGCFSFINLYLADAPYHLNSGQLANLFVVYLLGMVITPAAAFLLKKYGAARTMMLAVALSALGVMVTWTPLLASIVAGLAMMCTGVFITQSATISYIALNVRQGRSLAMGLYYCCYYLGGTVGSWVCALTYRSWHWHGVVLTLLAVQSIALLIIITLIWRRAPPPSSESDE